MTTVLSFDYSTLSIHCPLIIIDILHSPLQSYEVYPDVDYNQLLDLNLSLPEPIQEAVATEWTPSEKEIGMVSNQTQGHMESHYELESGPESANPIQNFRDECLCLKIMVTVLDEAGDYTESTPLDSLMHIAGQSIF